MTEQPRNARTQRRIYLAGPDVFLPGARDVLAAKQAICREHCLEGVSPLDNEVTVDPQRPQEAARAIFAANVAAMGSCRWCAANATPFRGVSLDPGTAFEIGYMCALGRTVYAYSAEPRDHAARVAAAGPAETLVRAHAGAGWLIEDFGLADNLMIPFAVLQSGGELIIEPALDREPLAAKTAFRRCIEAIARELG